MECHTYHANTQDLSRCWMVSASKSQSTHLSGWSSPRRFSLSVVQHLFQLANQMKILHRRGTQLFWSCRHGSKPMLPWKY
uniref:Uncharacterized protein n=1 Tax=Arundo donax TaxID=35708 RepID=A0A0A9AGK1_ARUDO